MRLNKLFKGLAVALPVMALTACGSTSSTNTGTSSNTSTDSEVTSTTGSDSSVQTGSATVEKSFEELQKEKMEALHHHCNAFSPYVVVYGYCRAVLVIQMTQDSSSLFVLLPKI